MLESKLKAIVKARVDAAVSYTESLKSERDKARSYYNGEPLGTEEEGRSQVVSRDVAEAVDSVMPGLIEVFTSGDKVVSFEPTGPEDIDAAEQATDYVNYIWNQQNDGFGLFYSWFQDAMILRLGVVKAVWVESQQSVPENYEGLDAADLEALSANPDLEIKEVVEEEDGTLTVKARREETTGQVEIENVPLEEFICLEEDNNPDKSKLIGQRSRKTISDLYDEGFDKEKLESIATAEADNDEEFDENALDPAMREVWVSEVYMRLDYDEDGFAELRKIILVGDDKILINEEVDTQPFSTISPIPIAHKLEGKSIYDQTADIQVIKTAIQRQIQDNMYLANTPRTEVVAERVNLDDLLNPQIGGIVRVTELNSTREIVTPFTAATSFPMIEYWDKVRENRTGIMQHNQGLDANILNSTAAAASIVDQGSMKRQKLIARVLAETGVKRIFRKILELICKHQDKPAVIRLRGQFIPIDPSGWNDKMDMTVAVGLGTGNKDQQLAHLMNLVGITKEIISFQQGINGPLVKPHNVYNILEKVVEASGLKAVEQFFSDPEQEPPQPQGPDPQQQAMEMQMQMVQFQQQLEQMKAQNDAQLKQVKAQSDIEVAQYKAKSQVEIDQFKAQQQSELETNKAITSAELELGRAQEKAELDRAVATEHAELDRDRAETAAFTQHEKAKLDAHMKGQTDVD